MNTSFLVKRAVVSALGVFLYIAVLAVLIFSAEKLFGPQDPGLLAPILFLTTFVVSACVTATLVLLKPLTLYLDGNKKDALHLFAYTVIALAAIALVVALILVGTA